jgi:oxygen-independent coproporphyrinogen-3 oxidase
LPGQRPEDFFRSLDAALALAPEHLSLYGLTYEPGTRLSDDLATGRLSRCPEESEREMYLGAVERLARAGLAQYEIANFARPGRESRHNLNYWRGGEYLGLGAGAHSFEDGERRGNVGEVEAYCARIEAGEDPTATSERLSPEKRAREALMLGLRMRAGVDLEEFRRRTGFGAEELFGATLSAHVAAGRAEISGGRLRLTIEGLLVADAVMAEFI